MFQQILGEPATGRLARVAFFKYTALLSVFVVLIVLYAVSSIYTDVQGVSLDLKDLRNLLKPGGAPEFDLWGSLTPDIVIFGAVILYASFNISVKRIRDVGLPVHWVLLGLFFTFAWSPAMFFVMLELSMLVLTVLPTDMFGEAQPA